MLTQDWDLGYRAEPSSDCSTSASPRARSSPPTTSPRSSSTPSDANATALLPVIAELELDGDAARGADLLDGWDGRADVDSAQAAYFAVFWRNLLDDMFGTLPEQTRPEGGDRWFGVVSALLGDPDARWWTNEDDGVDGRDAMIAAALDEAWSEASDRMGSDPDGWRWGRLHTLTLTNAELRRVGHRPDRVAVQPRALRARRRLVDRQRHRLGRGHRLRRRLGAVDAHDRRSRRSRRVHVDQPHGCVGPRVPSRTTPTRRRSGSAARRGRGRSRWPPSATRPPTRCSWIPPAESAGRRRRLRPRGTCAWARRCRAAAGGRSSSAGRCSSRASAPSSRAGARSRTAR